MEHTYASLPRPGWTTSKSPDIQKFKTNSPSICTVLGVQISTVLQVETMPSDVMTGQLPDAYYQPSGGAQSLLLDKAKYSLA
jgi:hypothetical protein